MNSKKYTIYQSQHIFYIKIIMNNLYVTLYTFELKKNKHQDNTNKVYSNNKENFIHFKNQIHLAFLKDPNFKNLNKLPELNTKEFFLVDYNHILHCIIIGTKILVPGWSLQIEKSLEFYINKKNLFTKPVSIFSKRLHLLVSQC